MVSSNTETGVAVSYEDGDGTLDFVLATAQPTVTSLGTLTALTVDNLNLDGSTVTASADFVVDAAGDINLDAGGGDWRLKDDDATICTISNVSGDLQLLLGTQDKDFKFQGNDGGSQITALTLDMSEGGRANFNNDIGLSDNRAVRLGSDDDAAIYNDGSNTYIKNATSNQDIIFQGNDDGSAGTTALTLDMSNHGQAIVEKSARIKQVALTSSSNAVAWDASAAANAYHVTTENTTFSAPSNALEGAIIQVEVAQGGTARTIAWNTVFEFAASTAPTVTATANKTDIFTFRYNGSVWQEIGRVQNLAQT